MAINIRKNEKKKIKNININKIIHKKRQEKTNLPEE